MKLWAAFWGALIFFAFFNYSVWAAPFGALLGLGVGYTLLRAVRTYVRSEATRIAVDEISKLRAEFSQALTIKTAAVQVTQSEVQAADLRPVNPFTTTAVVKQSAPIADATKPIFDAASTQETARPIPARDTFRLRVEAAETPKQPSEPSIVEKLFAQGWGWLKGGNTVVRVGVVILFIGLLFLAKFAADNAMFPVELRMAFVGLAGFLLFFMGFRLRAKNANYAMTLQGAGVAVLYLTVFASFRLYALLPTGLAFGLMLAVCAMSTAVALLQNSLALAVIAFAGGFAAPILVSTGGGQFEALFGYYIILSLAILFIAYKRAWRVLHLLGFAFSFGVMALWMADRYEPSMLLRIEPFLVGLFLIYVATPVLYAFKTATKFEKSTNGAVDASLIFGVPIATMGLQSVFMRHIEFGLAFCALALALFYLILSAGLVKRRLETQRLLIECFFVLCVGFITLAVPLALDARWTAAVWAVEGAGLFWVGLRQQRLLPRAFGFLLQIFSGVSFFASQVVDFSGYRFANPFFIGTLLLAASALILSWWMHHSKSTADSLIAKRYCAAEKAFSPIFFAVGFAWWMLGLIYEIRHYETSDGVSYALAYSDNLRLGLAVLAFVASALISALIGQRLKFWIALWPAHATAIAVFLGSIYLAGNGNFFNSPINVVIWVAALAMHFWLLRRFDSLNPTAIAQVMGKDGLDRPWFTAMHALSVWTVVITLGNLLSYTVNKGDLWSTAWGAVVLLVASIAVLLGLVFWIGNQVASKRWPLLQFRAAYQWFAAAPIAAFVLFGSLVIALTSNGRADPLPYVPLLNPVDLSVGLGLLSCFLWAKILVTQATGEQSNSRLAAKFAAFFKTTQAKLGFAAIMFVFINTIWLRVAHHFAQVNWRIDDLFESFLVQTGYAILWSTLALGLMIFAHRKVNRMIWTVGAGLLGLTVVKLFIVDLSNRGGSERIITFVGVGLLMLIVGYLAPLPPQAKVSGLPQNPDNTPKFPPASESTSASASASASASDPAPHPTL